jgi:hypothetical protein
MASLPNRATGSTERAFADLELAFQRIAFYIGRVARSARVDDLPSPEEAG